MRVANPAAQVDTAREPVAIKFDMDMPQAVRNLAEGRRR